MFILLVLSLFIVGCNNLDIESTNEEVIAYLKDNVDNPDSIVIESISWAMDDEGIIWYLITYDTENDSGEYLGYKTCIVMYDESPEDRIDPQDLKWRIVLSNEDDAFMVNEALYNRALADEGRKSKSGELSSQEIEEILLELSSSK